jgi:alpha-galactosidase
VIDPEELAREFEAARAAILKELLPPTGVAATFEDASLRAGTVVLPDARMLCLFNWEDAPDTRSVRVPGRGAVADYWTGERLVPRDGALTLDMPPRSARLLKVVAHA